MAVVEDNLSDWLLFSTTRLLQQQIATLQSSSNALRLANRPKGWDCPINYKTSSIEVRDADTFDIVAVAIRLVAPNAVFA
jgi:hypothetical protein